MNRHQWILKEDVEDACYITQNERINKINAESIQDSCIKFLSLTKKSLRKTNSRKKERNKAFKLSSLMILSYKKNAKDTARKKSYLSYSQDLQLEISSICAAKSKFLKKEKSCALTWKFKVRTFLWSTNLQKMLMIVFEINFT